MRTAGIIFSIIGSCLFTLCISHRVIENDSDFAKDNYNEMEKMPRNADNKVT